MNAKTYRVETISLNDLLQKYNCPKIFDYLSIDTEGTEYEIIKNLDFNKFSPKIITIEHNYNEVERNKMKNSNSVAIGCRFYENLPEKIVNKMGGIASNIFYESSIEKITQSITNPVFFLFSTHSSNVINIANYIRRKKYKVHVITEDKGFSGSIDNLWLLSQCKNHIISNSSFYWWGAYLSQLYYKKQIIICSNNFINKDSCVSSWKKN